LNHHQTRGHGSSRYVCQVCLQIDQFLNPKIPW
jgi:hypothetical protein